MKTIHFVIPLLRNGISLHYKKVLSLQSKKYYVFKFLSQCVPFEHFFDTQAQEEEVKLEKLEPADGNHAEVIGKMKEVINKLEDGLNQAEAKAERLDSPKLEVKDEIVSPKVKDEIASPKPEVKTEIDTTVSVSNETVTQTTSATVKDNKDGEKLKKSPSKIKKSKKLRLLQEKKVKKQVEKVKNELEEMKKQMEEMRKQMFEKTEELSKSKGAELPESFLLPGEWCCKWVNGQPVGKVSEVECGVKVDGQTKSLLRRSVEVCDFIDLIDFTILCLYFI